MLEKTKEFTNTFFEGGAPVQGFRSVLYQFIMAELQNYEETFEHIKKYLKKLMNYTLTY